MKMHSNAKVPNINNVGDNRIMGSKTDNLEMRRDLTYCETLSFDGLYETGSRGMVAEC